MNSDISLIRGRWIFTGDSILEHGAIAVQADTIVAVGPWDTLRATYPQDAVLGSEADAVMPGLINAHHHSNGVPNSLQGIEDDFLELWLFANKDIHLIDFFKKYLSLWSTASP